MAPTKGKGKIDAPPTLEQQSGAPPADNLSSLIARDTVTTMLMEVQRSLGKIESSITTLQGQVGALQTMTSKHDKWLFAAIAVGVVAGGFIAWTANTTKEVVLKRYIESAPTVSAPVQSPAPAAPALPAPQPAAPPKAQ